MTIHKTQTLEQKALDKAIRDVEQYGFHIHTMIYAHYINERHELDIRPFQWARHESRKEFQRFMSWAMKADTAVRILPHSRFMLTV